MTDWKQRTIDTYNKSAKELAEYFRGIGPRISDMELAFLAAGQPKNPRVIEIGCGDGRDAQVLVRHTDHYLGFDISEQLVKLAKEHVPAGHFEVADAASFDYPSRQDVVFAFASILHLDQNDLKAVIGKVYTCLKKGGVFYISSKYAPEFREQVKEDQFGQRMFYLYNAELIEKLVVDRFETVTKFRETRGNTEWFEIVLRKI